MTTTLLLLRLSSPMLVSPTTLPATCYRRYSERHHWQIGGVAVTSTAAELNILVLVLPRWTATELNPQLRWLCRYHDSAELPARCDQWCANPADSKTADGDNVNNLVGVTSADSGRVEVPQNNGADNYLFLVVDSSRRFYQSY